LLLKDFSNWAYRKNHGQRRDNDLQIFWYLDFQSHTASDSNAETYKEKDFDQRGLCCISALDSHNMSREAGEIRAIPSKR
jgi:hypothetical protein